MEGPNTLRANDRPPRIRPLHRTCVNGHQHGTQLPSLPPPAHYFLRQVNPNPAAGQYAVGEHDSNVEPYGMSPTDGELAASAKKGDLVAYERLMRNHWDAAYRVACAILGDPDQAEDAAQDCSVQAYTALSRFDERQEFGPWVGGIAARCALAALRRRRRAERLDQELRPMQDDDPDEALVAHDLQAAVRRAVRQLPEQQRIAIRLSALEGMDVAETARLMGCAAGTVKSHLYRARKKLRGLLSEYVEEDKREL